MEDKKSVTLAYGETIQLHIVLSNSQIPSMGLLRIIGKILDKIEEAFRKLEEEIVSNKYPATKGAELFSGIEIIGDELKACKVLVSGYHSWNAKSRKDVFSLCEKLDLNPEILPTA